MNDEVAGGDVLFASAASQQHRASDRPVRLRRLAFQFGLAAVAVLAAVALAGAIVSRRTAESQSVHEAARLSDAIATSVIQPVLTDAMANDAASAKAALDPVVRGGVLSDSLIRVKVWTPAGKILYSDEPRLVGMSFQIDDGARQVLSTPQTRAEVSDLKRPENRFERSEGKLLEVYRPVWTPSGRPLLFETYFRYDDVSARSSQLWRGFAGIMVSSLIAIFALLLPIGWGLFVKARRAQAQREQAMQRAVDASLEERRRIAATLHDGVVQELVAASFAVAAGAERATARGDGALGAELRDAAGAVRSSIGGLRSLLVDIYPPTLLSAGLPAALRDLVATLAGRGPTIHLDVDEPAVLDLAPDEEEAVFRIAQELLRNAVAHAGATEVYLALRQAGEAVQLTVADNGAGFDPARAEADGHFGLRLVSDLVGWLGAELRVATAGGTSWVLTVPAR
jgi:signal transduction histidine kinase